MNNIKQTIQTEIETTGSVDPVKQLNDQLQIEQTIQTEIETTESVDSLKQLKDQLQIDKNNNQINEILIKSLTNILTDRNNTITDRNNTITDRNNTINSLISSNDNLLLKITNERIESERLLSQIIININDLKKSKTSLLPLTEVIENIQEKDNSTSIDNKPNKPITKLYFNKRRYTRT